MMMNRFDSPPVTADVAKNVQVMENNGTCGGSETVGDFDCLLLATIVHDRRISFGIDLTSSFWRNGSKRRQYIS